jgi:CheY-like chemotaxis protein
MIERRVPLSEDQAKIVGMTRHAAEQGAELVKHLLAFARRQKLEPASIQIPRLAQTVTSLLAHTLGGMVELKWDLSDPLSPVYADAAQLELAVMNLIINARDAMPEGGVVTVAAEDREIVEQAGRSGLKPGHYVVIGVGDTGCGIAPELIQQVLEPFFTTKPVGKGTGLGLSMVYGFAQQSGGEVRVDSELGKGTCVEIWLPRAPETATEMVLAIADEAMDAAATAMKILLVDDHDGVRATTAALLEDLGHQVIHVTEGAHALDAFRQNPAAFDLLITDYAMPRMSGAELVRQIRGERADFPALIITGYAQADLNASENTDVRFLTKPFTADQLKTALRERR